MSGEGFEHKRNRQAQGNFQHMQYCCECHRRMENLEQRAIMVDPRRGVLAICIPCAEMEPVSTHRFGSPAHPVDSHLPPDRECVFEPGEGAGS